MTTADDHSLNLVIACLSVAALEYQGCRDANLAKFLEAARAAYEACRTMKEGSHESQPIRPTQPRQISLQEG